MVYSILSILWKKSNTEHAQKNCKVLRIVYTQGRRILYHPYGICFRGLHIEKIVLRWNEHSFCFHMGPNQMRPNGQPAHCKTTSEFYKNRYIRRYWFVFMFLLRLDGLPLVTFFCLFAVNILNLSRSRLIKVAKIWKQLLLL